MKKIIALVALAAAAPLANAAITSTFGACVQIAPPTIANFPNLSSPIAEAWNEQTNVTGTIFADLTTNPGNSGSPTPGVLTGMFDSHFIHYSSLPPGNVIGGAFFSSNIVAVAWNDTTLDLTDATWGAGGTIYPTGQIGRGVNTASGGVSVFGNMLRFNFLNQTGAIDIEQVRVWTHSVPAPGACSLAALAGVTALRRKRR